MLLATNGNLELYTDDGERGYVVDKTTQQRYPEMSVATIITRGHWEMAEDVEEKGGEGSGFRGHVGIPGHRGGSLPEGATGFRRDEWEKMDMGARRDAWGKLSVRERDKITNASRSVKARQEEVLNFAGARPAFTGDVDKAIDKRIDSFNDFVPDTALEHIKDITKELDGYLTQAGASPEIRHALAMEAIDSLVAQDNEAIGRTLGDHGIYHIGGNMHYSLDMMRAVPGEDSAADKAEVMIAGVFHDSGYLTAPSRVFLDEGHPRWSQQHYDENIRPLVEEALGSNVAGEISHIIRTHDTTDLNWQEDTVGSSLRTADNIALFHEEKLPGMFRYVPENIGVLEQLAKGEVDLTTARNKMVDNVEKSSYSSAVKERMLHAAREVIPVTPKFTLGMLGGEISGIHWHKDHIKIQLRKSEETERLNKIMEIGQRQFKKLAETYNQDVDQFSKTGKFTFKNTQGVDVLEAETIGEMLKQLSTAIVALSLVGDSDITAIQQEYISPEFREEELHVTLLFLGDTSELDKDAVVEVLQNASMVHAPITGVFNGTALLANDLSDRMPVVLLLDSPYLSSFYVVLKAYFTNANIIPNGKHGFTAHCTLGYVPVEDVDVQLPKEPLEIHKTFNAIELWWGGEHTTFPLTGTVEYKQLPIDERSKSNLISIRRGMFNDDVNKLAEQVYTGAVTIGDWEERMRQLVRELHTSTAAIGKGGWDQMTYADWGRVGPVLRDQYRYLHGFAEKIAEERDNISLEAIQARARMYGNAGEFSSIVVQAGDVLSKKLPWLPKDGSTDCLVNCKCYWKLDVVDTVKKNKLTYKLVQAVWNLRPAEHCDTCLERDGKVFLIEVHESVPVPETIA